MRSDQRTLLLTSTGDLTASRLLPYFQSQVVRIDLDAMQHTGFSLKPGCFEHEGRVYDSRSFSAVYWRKPGDPIRRVQHADQLMEFEYRQRLYAFHALTTIARKNGIWHLIDPFHEYHFPKPLQLDIARRFFRVPDWGVFVGPKTFHHPRVVAKAMAPSPVKEGRHLVTTRIADPSQLDPQYTWFLQQEIDAVQDATIVFCCDRMWAFALARAPDNAWVDWRLISDNHRPEQWTLLDVPEHVKRAVLGCMGELGTKFARIDFLIDEDAQWWFLEANMNGQFAWLDPDNQLGILSHIASKAETPHTHAFISE